MLREELFKEKIKKAGPFDEPVDDTKLNNFTVVDEDSAIELTVTITLNEYRELITIKASFDQRIKEIEGERTKAVCEAYDLRNEVKRYKELCAESAAKVTVKVEQGESDE